MAKLVLLIKHARGVGIPMPSGGIIYPDADQVTVAEPLPGRVAIGVQYNFNKVHQIPLLQEEPDELPVSLRKNADAALVSQFKLDQAKQLSENVRYNEKIIRMYKSYEDAGGIIILGRAKVDYNGNILETEKEAVPEVVPTVEPIKDEEVIEVVRKAGRPRKEQTEE